MYIQILNGLDADKTAAFYCRDNGLFSFQLCKSLRNIIQICASTIEHMSLGMEIIESCIKRALNNSCTLSTVPQGASALSRENNTNSNENSVMGLSDPLTALGMDLILDDIQVNMYDL